MQALPIPVGKRVSESLKACCRRLCRPLLPFIPDPVANRLPFLGRACIQGPDGLRVCFHTYGPYGKDRIAIKLARRGIWGYEGETTQLFLALVKDAQTVIDIGANTGLFALLAAKAKPSCSVVAYEPVPFIFDMLQRNILLNGLANLEAIPAAVSDKVGETSFYVTRTNVGVPTDSSACYGFREQVEELRLPTITLDAAMDRQRLARLDILKIDAEATEAKVLRGALRRIQMHRPFIICEVLKDIDSGYIQQTLRALDYRFFHITPAGLQEHKHLQGSLHVNERNYLFVHREKNARLLRLCNETGIAFLNAA
jgi:FkbM family methyltransferase